METRKACSVIEDHLVCANQVGRQLKNWFLIGWEEGPSCWVECIPLQFSKGLYVSIRNDAPAKGSIGNDAIMFDM